MLQVWRKLSIAIPAIDMAVGWRCYLALDSSIPLILLHHNYINIDRPLTIVTLLLIGGCQYHVSPNKTYSFITCKLLDKRLWKDYWTRTGLLSQEDRRRCCCCCCCDGDFLHLAVCASLFVRVCVHACHRLFWHCIKALHRSKPSFTCMYSHTHTRHIISIFSPIKEETFRLG